MTHEIVIAIAKRVKEIDGRISVNPQGAAISGCFRGKGSESYEYCVTSRSFKYNNNGPSVRKAFEQAVSELYPA